MRTSLWRPLRLYYKYLFGCWICPRIRTLTVNTCKHVMVLFRSSTTTRIQKWREKSNGTEPQIFQFQFQRIAQMNNNMESFILTVDSLNGRLASFLLRVFGSRVQFCFCFPFYHTFFIFHWCISHEVCIDPNIILTMAATGIGAITICWSTKNNWITFINVSPYSTQCGY